VLEWLFCVCCAQSCQALPLWSELTNHILRNRDGVHFFTLKFECHNRYNKSLVCNSASGNSAWCNKNNSEWGFRIFLKQQKPISFQKKLKTRIKKEQKVRFFLNPDYLSTFFCDFPFIARSGVSYGPVWLGVRRTPGVKVPGY